MGKFCLPWTWQLCDDCPDSPQCQFAFVHLRLDFVSLGEGPFRARDHLETLLITHLSSQAPICTAGDLTSVAKHLHIFFEFPYFFNKHGGAYFIFYNRNYKNILFTIFNIRLILWENSKFFEVIVKIVCGFPYGLIKTCFFFYQEKNEHFWKKDQ